MDFDLKSLHPLEIRLLRHVSKNEKITTERITGELSYKLWQCNQAFSWLSAKSYIVARGPGTIRWKLSCPSLLLLP